MTQDDPNKTSAWFQVPDHELLKRIGKGSYGQVFLARSLTGCFRAVKIVDRSTAKPNLSEKEFNGIRNFEPVSLSHEGFVHILHVGEDKAGGFFYYVMEVADDEKNGQTIDPGSYKPRTLQSEVRHRGRLPIAECINIGISLTAALDHLHRHQLIHRDIKLGNIIFVNGKPKLADVGLVTSIGGGTYTGTEGYIPSEGPGQPQADIFSLGKVLYEISTGKDRMEFPDFPTNLDQLPPAERAGLLQLNRITNKACEADVRNRYQTARQIHDDLVRLAADRLIPPKRGLRRHATLLTVAAACVAVVILSAAIFMGQKPQPQAAANPSISKPPSVAEKAGAPSLPDALQSVGSFPAAEVLKLAYTGKLSVPVPAAYRSQLPVDLRARRKGATEFTPMKDGDEMASDVDGYRVVVQPLSAGYLYVFQVDPLGNQAWLFPRNETFPNSSGGNPVASGQLIQIPSHEQGGPLKLDRNTGTERIYAVFCAVRWPELETALALRSLPSVTNARLSTMRKRGPGGILPEGTSTLLSTSGPLLVVERWFKHIEPQ